MHTVLEVMEQKVKGYPYFRLHLPKNLTNLLGLQKGDTLTIEIEAVKRNGSILYQAKGEVETNAV